MKRLTKQIAVLCMTVSAVFLSACSRAPMPEVEESFKSAEETSDYYLFKAENPVTDTCYIYYPGGMVHEEAYGPYMKMMAEKGVHSFLLRLTFDMALFETEAADDAKNSEFAKANCKKFALGGHSLGALGIAAYGQTHPDDGLVFIAGYPDESQFEEGGSMQGHSAPAISISASNDLLATVAEVEEAKPLMPKSTEYVVIEGGNHAGFGYYGTQGGDGEAKISREEQHKLLVDYTLQLIKRM